MLLLLLFDLPCPGGALDRRELCRFIGGMNGSAPGTASSVSPTLEFGALAIKSGGSVIGPGELSEYRAFGDPDHIKPGECLNATESILGPRGVCVDTASSIGFSFCSEPRHESISSSSIGVTPRRRNGAWRFL